MATETLTEDMIRALRSSARAAGDHALEIECNTAIYGPGAMKARRTVAKAINDARHERSQTVIA